MKAISEACLREVLDGELTPKELCDQLEEMEFDYTMQALQNPSNGEYASRLIFTFHQFRKALAASITD